MPEFFSYLATVLWIVELGALGYVAYRGALGLLGLRRRRPLPPGSGDTRFLVLVPARNEEGVIGETVRHLQGLDYPADQRLVFVVADDCSDATAAVAAAAGAHVLRKPAPATTKGAVIQWALAHPDVAGAAWDALVIFDADSRPAANFLKAMDAAIAAGEKAIQSRSESHGQKGWVPTAYAVNTTQRNRTWHQAREMAGFSAALTGTGICFTRQVLKELPPNTRTLTEDLEYGAKLTLAGIRVRYLHEAVTVIDQPPSLKASAGQRLRWARGQLRTALSYAPALVVRALTRRDISALDTALYLLLPSVVPFQALLGVCGLGSLLANEAWPQPAAGLPGVPFFVVAAVLGFSLLLPYLGLRAERAHYAFRDWVAFLLLMLTWLPIAAFGAFTMWVEVWNRTPRRRAAAAPEAAPADVERLRAAWPEEALPPIDRQSG